MNKSLEQLEDALGHQFSNRDLLQLALVHSSATEHSLLSNERLEFLGDRVLGLVISEHLYQRFDRENEGQLARRFAGLTSRDALAHVAGTLKLDAYVSTSAQDKETSARGRASLLADALESVLGALFLDGGLDVAGKFIRAHWEALIDADIQPPKDSKTALQEWSQARELGLPVYNVIEQSGPAHQPQFKIEVVISGEETVTGTGSSRRSGERDAAEQFLNKKKSEQK